MRTNLKKTKDQIRVRPVTVGEVLREEFLEPNNLTQAALARHIGVDTKTINRLCTGHATLSFELAQKLGAAFGMDAHFWINIQRVFEDAVYLDGMAKPKISRITKAKAG